MYLRRYIYIAIYSLLVYLFSLLLYYYDYIHYFFDKHDNFNNTVFDYIIVGCGSAGAIVARRLAEDKHVKVLVLEAGKHVNDLLNIPSLGILLQQSPYDWQYKTVPQTESCLALNENISYWPSGKIVGGNTKFNNMLYIRGHPEDFKEWFKDKEGFDYTEDIVPYFKKLEIESKESLTGSLHISDLPFTSVLPLYILNAVKSLGFIVSDDTQNCKKGFGIPKVNVLNGKRWSASTYLESKSNIILHTNQVVRKILFHDNFEAYAVEYSHYNKVYYAKATEGIILSAGVIGSPRILLHSGVGPNEHLNEINIASKVDLPVGDNLQDHITTGFDLVLLNQSVGLGIEQMLSPFSMLDYFWNGGGPWTTIGCEVMGFIDTKCDISRQEDSKQPDLELMIIPLGIAEDSGVHLRKLMGISDYTWGEYFSLLNKTTALTILPILLHPKSRGYVRLQDNHFESMPLINPNYLTHKDDVEILLKGIDLIKEIISTNSMKKIGARLNRHIFPGCEDFKFDSKPYWECYVRHLTITSYHPVGTCKMGPEGDDSTVVDFNFQVKGTNKLFVVDGSVMPKLTSGNVNGAISMLAEMASDLLKFRDFLNRNKCELKEMFLPKLFC